jgi:hypothetical protein
MKYAYLWCWLLAGLTGLSACSGGGISGQSTPEVNHFFDLAGFMELEIDRLETKRPSVDKILEINDQREELSADSIDYAQELSIFSKADINKVSWIEKYAADTTLEGGQVSKVVYTALDEDLKTRAIEIDLRDESPVEIRIQNRMESPILKAWQRMVYRPERGFEIEQEQKVRLLPNKRMKVSVKFQE